MLFIQASLLGIADRPGVGLRSPQEGESILELGVLLRLLGDVGGRAGVLLEVLLRLFVGLLLVGVLQVPAQARLAARLLGGGLGLQSSGSSSSTRMSGSMPLAWIERLDGV